MLHWSQWITVDLQICLVRVCASVSRHLETLLGNLAACSSREFPRYVPTWEAHHGESSLSTGRTIGTIGWLADGLQYHFLYLCYFVLSCATSTFNSTSFNQSVPPLFLSGWYFSASLLYARLGQAAEVSGLVFQHISASSAANVLAAAAKPSPMAGLHKRTYLGLDLMVSSLASFSTCSTYRAFNRSMILAYLGKLNTSNAFQRPCRDRLHLDHPNQIPPPLPPLAPRSWLQLLQ